MDKRKIGGSILIGVGACCLVAALVIWGKRQVDDKALQEQMETLRPMETETGPGEMTGEDSGNDGGGATAGTGESGEEPGTETTGMESPGTAGTGESGMELGAEAVGTEDPGTGTAGTEGGGAATGTGESGMEPGTETTGTESPEAGAGDHPLVSNPYAEAYLQNGDMVAWLKVDGTVIDYPVMQTMEDEDYYLERGFDKKDNQNGCLIMDTDSVVTGDVSTNLIIHGHNMRSGAMFGDLEKYEDADYCEEHKRIQLYTRECLHEYEVISVFRSQVYRKTDQVFKYYKFFQADTQEEFDDWYDNIMELAQFDTGVTAQFGDRFLTLSTCVYHVTNGRLVVVAKEVGQGDHYEPVE